MIDPYLFRELTENKLIYTFNPYQINTYYELNQITLEAKTTNRREKKIVTEEMFKNKVRSLTDLIVNNFFAESKEIKLSSEFKEIDLNDFQLRILEPIKYHNALLEINKEINRYILGLKHLEQINIYTLFSQKFTKSIEITPKN